jgi:hypothetical protein
MNEQQLIKLLESAEGTIARLMLEVNRLSKEVEWLKETDEQVIANAEKRFPFLKMRELTDEEITEEIEKIFGKIIDPEVLKDELTLARAILKKASEK